MTVMNPHGVSLLSAKAGIRFGEDSELTPRVRGDGRILP